MQWIIQRAGFILSNRMIVFLYIIITFSIVNVYKPIYNFCTLQYNTLNSTTLYFLLKKWFLVIQCRKWLYLCVPKSENSEYYYRLLTWYLRVFIPPYASKYILYTITPILTICIHVAYVGQFRKRVQTGKKSWKVDRWSMSRLIWQC